MNSEEKSDVFFQEALAAETSSDWPTVKGKCEQGPQIEGITASREAHFRRLRAKALVSMGMKRRDAYDAPLLQEAIAEIRRAIPNFRPDSATGKRYLIELYGNCGDASYALSMTQTGSDQKRALVLQATENYEKLLQIKPEDRKTRELLEHLKKQSTPGSQQAAKSGCSSVILIAIAGVSVILSILIVVLK